MRWVLITIALALLVAMGFGFAFHKGEESAPWGPAASPPKFVGSEACAGCHKAETERWRSSQHSLAMQKATDKSVLGDFNAASFDYFGVRSHFLRRDGKFVVQTDGPDGKLADFEVKYTFGVDPLQQYLVELADGRLQALSLAWDTRPKEKGGQRWFHLYPHEQIRHDDVLHWTKLNQNWNFMCAQCHSTGVQKNYDAAADRFATSFAEISVGCEACHGQGSRHVQWARDRQRWWNFALGEDPSMGLAERFSEHRQARWSLNAATGNATRSIAPQPLRAEVETCGLCHARRAQFSEDWRPGQWLSETAVVAPLRAGLYFADGQMQDEVYNYGPFKQSKMFAAGVTCSDCHEPHGAALRASGDALCFQCHAPGKYDAVAHRHHEGVSPAPGCVSCHMPVRTYMIVDPRHDHSFRIPRPDQTIQFKTPNACNSCHSDRSAQWAASAIQSWHGSGQKGFQTYAPAFDAAWNERADPVERLVAVASNPETPAFARAGALSELGTQQLPPTAANLDMARAALGDPDPMVRVGALEAIENLPPGQRWSLASDRLSDSVRGVRIQAASLLADVAGERLSPEDQTRYERAAEEFVAAQRFNADRPEARVTLGAFYVRRGRLAEAEAEYQAAIRLNPQFAGAAVDLADLYRQMGREVQAEEVLRVALERTPADAGVHHALGLSLVRLGRRDAALTHLQRASILEPENPRYAYVYAVALHSSGRVGDAMTVLKNALGRHPYDRDLLSALIAFSRDAGDKGAELGYAERLLRVDTDNEDLLRLVVDLRGQTKVPANR